MGFNPEKHVGEEHGLTPTDIAVVIRETTVSAWDAPPRSIRERLIDGHLLTDTDPVKAAEIADVFCDLTDEEAKKFWANVEYEIHYEEWLAGDREHHPAHPPKAERKQPLMSPPILSPTCLPLEEALNRLERVRVRGDEWVARCPVHEDRSPSLVVMEHKDFPGEGFFWCYAGCTHLQVRAKLLGMRNGG